MSLRSFLRDHFGLGLRNKPGGMAWINSNIDFGCGEAVLVNRVVRTVRLTPAWHWEIDPPQRYVATRLTRFIASGVTAKAGDTVICIAVTDDCLTPIPGGLVSEREVDRLYQPGPQIKAKETA